MDEIARSRGSRFGQSRKTLESGRREAVLSQREGSGGEVTTWLLPLGGRPPNGNNQVVGPGAPTHRPVGSQP